MQFIETSQNERELLFFIFSYLVAVHTFNSLLTVMGVKFKGRILEHLSITCKSPGAISSIAKEKQANPENSTCFLTTVFLTSFLYPLNGPSPSFSQGFVHARHSFYSLSTVSPSLSFVFWFLSWVNIWKSYPWFYISQDLISLIFVFSLQSCLLEISFLMRLSHLQSSEVDENQGREMSDSGRNVLWCNESKTKASTLVRDGIGWQPCQSPAMDA